MHLIVYSPLSCNSSRQLYFDISLSKTSLLDQVVLPGPPNKSVNVILFGVFLDLLNPSVVTDGSRNRRHIFGEYVLRQTIAVRCDTELIWSAG